jgi:hypothetical protein
VLIGVGEGSDDHGKCDDDAAGDAEPGEVLCEEVVCAPDGFHDGYLQG